MSGEFPTKFGKVSERERPTSLANDFRHEGLIMLSILGLKVMKSTMTKFISE